MNTEIIEIKLPKDVLIGLFITGAAAVKFTDNRNNNEPMFAEDVQIAVNVSNAIMSICDHVEQNNPHLMNEIFELIKKEYLKFETELKGGNHE